MKKRKVVAFFVVMSIASGMSVGSVAAKEGAEAIAYETMVDRVGNSERGMVAQGSCGEGVIYSLDSNGVLNIAGSGKMTDYEWEESPFYEYQDQIKELVIEEGVTYIGKHAFCENNMLQVVKLATSVTEIGDNAFAECYRLNQVTLNEGLVSIHAGAFSECGSLTSIQLPNSLESIGDTAFEYCGLTSIKIPANVIYIGAGAFDSQKLESIEIDGNNQGYTYEDSILYNKEKTHIVGVTGTIGEELIISDTVTSIGNGAFCGCSSLKKITIPDSVVSIGAGAFSYSGLTSITLPSGLTRLEEHLFAGCSDLKEIVFPENLEEIGARAFYFCTGIENVELPERLEVVETAAFYNCTNLTKIQMPASMVSLGEQAFASCSKLLNLTVPNGITCLEYQAFGGCRQLQTIELPNTLTSIKKEAFTQCNCLTEITIPQSVTSIGNGAFAYCRSLIDVTIPEGVTSLGETVFRQCDALERVTIPKSVTSIDKTLFYLVNHDITIVGELGSYAQTFAQEIKMPFRSLDGTVIQPTCTITYDPTGGVLQGDGSKTVVKNTSIGKHPTATKDGYVFKGWYLYRTGGTKMPENVPIQSDLTVYAVWEPAASENENGNNNQKPSNDTDSSNQDTSNQDAPNQDTSNKDSSNKDNSNKTDVKEKIEIQKVYTVGQYKYKVLNETEVAFAGLKNNKTKKVVIGKTVEIKGKNFKITTVAAKALKGKKITSLEIGANIKKIETRAFENCKKLKKITIKSTQLKNVGKKSFKGIPKTAKVKVSKKKRTAYKKQLQKAGLNKKVKVSS